MSSSLYFVAAQALEMADDQATLAELSQHSLKIDALEIGKAKIK